MLKQNFKVFIPLEKYDENSEIGGMAEAHKDVFNNCVFTFSGKDDLTKKIEKCLETESRNKLFE
jgi:hypothetical protein